MRNQILVAFHENAGHWQTKTTAGLVRDMCWWPTMQRDAKLHVQSCHACRVSAPGNATTAVGMQPITGLFHTISLDFTGPLPTTTEGKPFVLVSVKHLSGWPIIRVVRNQTTDVATKLYRKEISGQFGSLLVVLSDNGPAFTSAAWTKEMSRCGSKAITVAAYTPQANGRAERMIQTVKRSLSRLICEEKQKWDAALEVIESTYRSRRMADGFFPFWLMFGTNPRSVIHAGYGNPFKDFHRHLDTASREVLLTGLKGQRARRMVAKSIVGNPFQVGDIVLMELPCTKFNGALKLHWARPLVVWRVNDARCWLKDEGLSRKSKDGIHIRRLRHYFDRQM